ncbi:unnamed protein product [Pedinophyceae sp. YPF-701]|nr:unnamed protein product [Pedinophyceae sp. YPF-701]
MSGGGVGDELRAAVHDTRERCLLQSSKWAAEQLVALPPAHGHGKARGAADLDLDDAVLLGRSLVECREYLRAANILKSARGPVGRFLYHWARYLAGEKRRKEEQVERTGPLGRVSTSNRHLSAIEADICSELGLSPGQLVSLPSSSQQGPSTDPFLLYMFGLVLTDLGKLDDALVVLLRSVSLYPCHWGAWLAIKEVAKQRSMSVEQVRNLHGVPQHWMCDAFLASMAIDAQENEKAILHARKVRQIVPASPAAELVMATAQYQLRQYEEAQQGFEELISRDPYRVEGLDCFSNILYTLELLPELSSLAQRLVMTDKYRPETQCVIGNYYSLRNEHGRAVEYYRRAIRLNPQYISAWTLMGHELLELKNAPAAIEAYRRAVDIDARDFRAWYGLGMVYELMFQQYYALYYFKKAVELRPHDPRMWCAVGQSYESDQMKMYDSAIRCYRRAVDLDDPDGVALQKLAKLHDRLGDSQQAAYFYEANLRRLDGEEVTTEHTSEALLFLARHNLNEGDCERAQEYASRLLDTGGRERELAKSLLREIRSILEAKGRQPSMPVGALGGEASDMEHDDSDSSGGSLV